MNILLKWILVGLSAAAVLAVVVFFLPTQTSIEDRADMKWQVPDDVSLDLPPMPQMLIRNEVYGPPLLPTSLPEEKTDEIKAVKETVPPSLSYEMEEDIPPPPPLVEEKINPSLKVKSKDLRPKIAIIIDDMGLNHHLSVRATQLPSAITMAYLPYAPNLKVQASSAVLAGHDLMLHFPMEPEGNQNPGPDALLTTQSIDEWERLIEKNLNSFHQFIGVNNHMGSKFTTDSKGLAFVAHALSQRGLFFIDSRTTAKSVASKVIKVMGVKTASRDVFLDHVVEKEAIRLELARAEQIARKKGAVIIIGHPHKETLSVIESWVLAPSFKDFQLVPVRTLVK